MDYTHYIADSNLALSAGDFEAALKSAESALSVDKGKTEAYYCAGKALMSMGKIDEAISYFQKALKINDHDGNGFFLLGYAQAMSDKTYEALRSLTGLCAFATSSDKVYEALMIITSVFGNPSKWKTDIKVKIRMNIINGSLDKNNKAYCLEVLD